MVLWHFTRGFFPRRSANLLGRPQPRDFPRSARYFQIVRPSAKRTSPGGSSVNSTHLIRFYQSWVIPLTNRGLYSIPAIGDGWGCLWMAAVYDSQCLANDTQNSQCHCIPMGGLGKPIPDDTSNPQSKNTSQAFSTSINHDKPIRIPWVISITLW